MSKSFLPAYVFLYTDRTVEGFRNAEQTGSKKILIDVQNSAPPFNKIETNAWLTSDCKKIAFENGSPMSIVQIVYAEVLAHLDYVTAARVLLEKSSTRVPNDAWK